MAQYFDMGKCWSFGGFETDTGHYYNVFSNPGKGTGGCAYVNPYNGNVFYGTEKDLIYFSTSTYNISGNPDRIDSNVELLINNFISK